MQLAGCPPRYHRDLIGLAFGRPTVGDLMTLCEENFVLLCRLAPHLKDQRGLAVSRRKGSVDLFLRVELAFCLRQGHRFGPDGAAVPLPQGGDLIDTLT